MLRNFVYLMVGSLFMSGCIAVHETKTVPASTQTRQYARTSQAAPSHVAEHKPRQVLRHVVLMKFKDDASATDVRKIETAFAALPSKVSLIQDFEWGTDVSAENLQDGFTHCFVVTFLSEADRDAYIAHPEHKKFGQMLGPVLDKVLVIDYWTKR